MKKMLFIIAVAISLGGIFHIAQAVTNYAANEHGQALYQDRERILQEYREGRGSMPTPVNPQVDAEGYASFVDPKTGIRYIYDTDAYRAGR